MKINIEAIKELIKERFRDNQAYFADEIGISREYVNRLLNGKIHSNSDKLCNSIIKYCELNNLDFRKYIFLK